MSEKADALPVDAPCVGCGWCCLHDQCDESMRQYGYQRRCPNIQWRPELGRYRCAMVDHPDLGPLVRASQAIGSGCCAKLNDWRGDVRDRDADFP